MEDENGGEEENNEEGGCDEMEVDNKQDIKGREEVEQGRE